jgi:hypothetical protein
MALAETVRVSTNSKLFAYSRKDVIPVLAGVAHFA